MKRYLLVIMLFLGFYALRAQNGYWEEAKGPYGGEVMLTRAGNGKLYAQQNFSTRAIYSSLDNGNTWEGLSKNFNNTNINFYQFVIGEAGNLFYKSDKWYKSIDEGLTWNPLGGLSPTFIKIAETVTGKILGFTSSDYIYLSTDGGQTWILKTTAPSNEAEDLSDFEVTAFGGILARTKNQFNGPTEVIFRSIDDGQSWNRIEFNNEYTLRFISPSGAFFFSKFPSSKLYRSTNEGQTLLEVASYSSISRGFTTLSNGNLIAVFSNSLYNSTDDGLSWQKILGQYGGGSISPSMNWLQQIPPSSDGTIFCTILNSLHQSKDGGLTWTLCTNGIRKASSNNLKFLSDSIYLISTSNGIWKSYNAGTDWNRISTYNIYSDGSFELTNNGGVISLQDNRVLYSPSGDENFADISPSAFTSSSFNKVYIDPKNDILFVNTIQGFERSYNFGQNWETCSGVDFILDMAFHPSGRIFATDSRYILVSDDLGISWDSILVPDIINIKSIWVAPNGKTYLEDNIGLNSIFMTSDNRGETWVRCGMASLIDTKPIFSARSDLFAFNSDYILSTSLNEGLTWQTLPQPPSGINKLALTPNQKLFIVGANGRDLYISTSPVIEGAYIKGQVMVDSDSDCLTPDTQVPLKNRILKASGSTYNYFTKTDPDGHYIFFVDTGFYKVEVQNPSEIWWNYCQDTITLDLPTFFASDTANFIALPLANCPLISVNVAIPQLRRCFDNQVYIEYCNQGTETADSAWVDVMLDPSLTFISSTQPHEIQANQNIRFFVGDVLSGDCGQFQLTVNVDCDSTVLGQTHCIGAHGFPDTLCTPVPEWSGANILASVSCQDTTLQFKLENTGSAVSQNLEYIIIEDDVVLFSGQHSYEVGESSIFNQPANGSTWRIESAQEPGHPFSTLALAFAEGCGGFNSLGYINQFPVNGIQPSWHRMCVENVGSYDPNDKQGFPNGVGTEHNIRPGQDLDYLIRFQNTGTDTAFTVVIKDTLSAFLDPGTIRPGASSHAYTWNLSGQGVISFTFNNIMLPDSNVNEPRSHGFVQFNISPFADVPLGSVIENDAAIYFDFNTPIITNTTWHTLAKSPLISAVRPEPQKPEAGLDIWPNPFIENTSIHLDPKVTGQTNLKLFDGLGNLVFQKTSAGTVIPMNLAHLPAGIYWVELRDKKGGLIGREKIVKQ
jgi:uncharacterized repeat protein (TIGR01451 family)